MPRVLFVCLGNICRSPMAEGAFRAIAPDIAADSAGVAGWHAGDPPDPRAVAEAARHGVDISGLRARRATPQDFHDFDLIMAMDRSNLAALEAIAPPGARARLRLMLGRDDGDEVPDPYYGGDEGFSSVWATLTRAAQDVAEECRNIRL